MIFKPYECDFGFKFGGVDYAFEYINSLTIEDPEFNRITRGSNAGNLTGLAYKEGSKEPKTWTAVIMNMTAELKDVLDQIFADQSRVDVYAIRRSDGSAKMGRNAVLCQKPQQLVVDDSVDSINVSLIFQTFDSTENHKA